MKSVFASEVGSFEPSFVVDINYNLIYRAEHASPHTLIPFAEKQLKFMEQDIYQSAFYPKFTDYFRYFDDQEKLKRLALQHSESLEQAYPSQSVRIYLCAFTANESNLSKKDALGICRRFVKTGQVSYFDSELLNVSNVIKNRFKNSLILSSKNNVITATKSGEIEFLRSPKIFHIGIDRLQEKILQRLNQSLHGEV